MEHLSIEQWEELKAETGKALLELTKKIASIPPLTAPKGCIAQPDVWLLEYDSCLMATHPKETYSIASVYSALVDTYKYLCENAPTS